jgi:hypothetical protein
MAGMSAAAISAIVSATAAAGSAYQNKRASDQNQARQRQTFEINANENQRQQEAELSRDQQLFQAQQLEGDRAVARDETKDNAISSAIEPLAEINNAPERVNTEEQAISDVSQADLDLSLQNGEQASSSGVAGEVSDAFTEASEASTGASVKKAGRNIALNSILGGLAETQRDDINNVTKAGVRSNILKGSAARQGGVDEYYRRLAEQRAVLDNTLAPSPTVLV